MLRHPSQHAIGVQFYVNWILVLSTQTSPRSCRRRAACPPPAVPQPCVPRQHSKLNTSANPPRPRKPPPTAWSYRSQLQLSGQQPLPASSICCCNLRPERCPASPTQRPARSHRRSFGASSPCRKNEQENCMFTWEWRPRRPPASPPAAGESFPAPPSSSTSSHERPRAHDQPSPEHPALNPPIL